MHLFLYSAFAGVMISIGGTVYLSSDSKIAGALLFTIGLAFVCIYKMNLFTGKIGYLIGNRPKYILDLIVIWIGNLAGTAIVSSLLYFAKAGLAEKAQALCEKKLEQAPLQTIVLAAFCGLLIHLAVDHYKSAASDLSKFVGLFLCVSVFILSGFEHSIADMFYFGAANIACFLSGKAMIYVLLVTLGNCLGAFVLPLLQRVKPKAQ